MQKHHILLPVFRPKIISMILLTVLLAVLLVQAISLVRSTRAATSDVITSPINSSSAPASDFWTKERMAEANANPDPFFKKKPAATTTSTTTTSTVRPVSDNEYLLFPASVVGKVFYAWPNADGTISGTGSCTGVAVSSKNESVVATAAHCLYQSTWAVNVSFCPQYNNGNGPHDCWNAKQTNVLPEWPDVAQKVIGNQITAAASTPSDIGMIIVQHMNGNTLLSQVGGVALVFDQSQTQNVTIYGYPNNYNTAKQMYLFTGPAQSYTVNTGLIQGVTGDDMGLGSSGGPWFISFQGSIYLNGITSSESDDGIVTYSIYFGATVSKIFNEASVE
jgi:hypothetical protein